MSYHSITLVGNLGRDPEMRYTPSGQAVTNFSVAVNERWSGQDGEKHERTIWVRCAAWGRTAEVANEYLKKGRQVMVVGRLTADHETGGPRTFTRQDGTVGASYEVTVNRLVLLGSRGDAAASAEDEDESHGSEDTGEDLPF